MSKGRTWSSLGRCLAVLVALVSTGCGADDEGRVEGSSRPLLIMAASSLRPVVPPLVAEFERRTAASVLVVYGSSSGLAAQVESGAPADLFLSADEISVDRLIASGRGRAGTRLQYGTGRLELIWGEGVRPLSSLEELTRAEYRVIAIANPRTAPYGAAATSALSNAGVLDRLDGRLVHAESVADAYQLVRTGNADAAFVSATLTAPLEGDRALAVASGLHSPLLHVAVIPTGSDHPRATELLDFIRSKAARTILSVAGLEPAQD